MRAVNKGREIMKNKIRVVLVDSDIEQLSSIEKYFSGHAVIDVVKCFTDGLSAIDYIKSGTNKFDMLITDLLLTKKDGLNLIKEMKDNNIEKSIIVLTGYNSLDMIKKVSLYNINYFMLKPFDFKDLEYQILCNKEFKGSILDINKELQSNITTLLHSLGVPSHIKGYEYIREGIGLMYNNPGLLGAITKEMYPEIAFKYNTTSSRVERAIRHAIEISWNRGDYDLMEEVFGHSVDFDRAKPTNSEFIATIADKLRLDTK